MKNQKLLRLTLTAAVAAALPLSVSFGKRAAAGGPLGKILDCASCHAAPPRGRPARFVGARPAQEAGPEQEVIPRSGRRVMVVDDPPT